MQKEGGPMEPSVGMMSQVNVHGKTLYQAIPQAMGFPLRFWWFSLDLMGILDHSNHDREIAGAPWIILTSISMGKGGRWIQASLKTSSPTSITLNDYHAFGFSSDNFRDTVKRTLLAGHRCDSQHPANDFSNIPTANVGKVGPAHFIQPQQAIQYVECHDNATVLIISNLKEEIRLEERKPFLTPRSSFGIIIPRCTFYPCGSRTLPHKRARKTTPITCQIVSIQLTWHPFQNANEAALWKRPFLR